MFVERFGKSPAKRPIGNKQIPDCWQSPHFHQPSNIFTTHVINLDALQMTEDFQKDAPGKLEFGSRLEELALEIRQALDEPLADDSIRECGTAPLRIIADLPDEVLALAYDKLSAWPYHAVPICWRRLYEDASLHKAIYTIHDQLRKSNASSIVNGKKADLSNNLIDLVVTCLDKGLTISGAPARQDVFEFAFQQLECLIDHDADSDIPSKFNIRNPDNMSSQHEITRAQGSLNFDVFQRHLTDKTTPLIIPNSLDHWPATKLWHDPRYFLRRTLGGRRLVPIEIGSSYTDEDWGQRAMYFREFLQKYLLPAHPVDIGYLAQHDLFAQIPALRNDISIPDYCYTMPPKADTSAARTAGLSSANHLESPLLNAWFGPKGTKTPLHTDPYHNILCQVVGYKYVRLYPPEETPKVYPRGVDEKGISMENTSEVDISLVRPAITGKSGDSKDTAKLANDFPLLSQARYVEAILQPGECLYVPLGWWHYVEGLSTSFSVSFWWN